MRIPLGLTTQRLPLPLPLPLLPQPVPLTSQAWARPCCLSASGPLHGPFPSPGPFPYLVRSCWLVLPQESLGGPREEGRLPDVSLRIFNSLPCSWLMIPHTCGMVQLCPLFPFVSTARLRGVRLTFVSPEPSTVWGLVGRVWRLPSRGRGEVPAGAQALRAFLPGSSGWKGGGLKPWVSVSA